MKLRYPEHFRVHFEPQYANQTLEDFVAQQVRFLVRSLSSFQIDSDRYAGFFELHGTSLRFIFMLVFIALRELYGRNIVVHIDSLYPGSSIVPGLFNLMAATVTAAFDESGAFLFCF